jgi:hypothetical protein
MKCDIIVEGLGRYTGEMILHKTEPVPPVDQPPIEPPPVDIPPVEPPSTDPGNATRPTSIENMALDGNIYTAISPFPKKNAALYFHVPDVDYNKVLTVDFERALYAMGKGNEKIYRMHNDAPITQGNENWYMGTPEGSWIFWFGEYIDTDNDLHILTKFPPFDGKFHKEKLIFIFSSGPGKKDGSIAYYVDGLLYAFAANVQFDDANKPTKFARHYIQYDTPNWDPSSPSMKVKADSISYKVTNRS